MNPIFKYLYEKKKFHKYISAALTIALFTIFVFLPIMLLMLLLFQEIRHLITFVQTQSANILYWQNMLYSILKQYNIPYQNIQIDTKEIALSFLSFLSQHATTIISRAGSFLGNSAFTLLLAYYMLTEKEHIVKFFRSINPLHTKHAQQLYTNSIKVINRTVKGNIILMILQSIIGIMGLSIFGSIAPILLGLLYGIFSIIPTLGAFLIWIPITVYLYFYQGLIFAIGFLLWCILSSFIVEEYIAPRLMDEDAHMPPILIVMSVLGAVEQFGLIGMLLGPTIVTLAFAAIQIYKEIIVIKNR